MVNFIIFLKLNCFLFNAMSDNVETMHGPY